MNHLITELNLNDYPECIICLDNFVLHEPVILTSCGHIFHKKCLNSWEKERCLISSENDIDFYSKKERDCPVCRCDYSNKFFDNLVIDKWTEKGKKIDFRNYIFKLLSIKSLKLILKKLFINYHLCLEKEDLIKLIIQYIENKKIPEIKDYLDNLRIDYSKLIEKKDLENLYLVILTRTIF